MRGVRLSFPTRDRWGAYACLFPPGPGEGCTLVFSLQGQVREVHLSFPFRTRWGMYTCLFPGQPRHLWRPSQAAINFGSCNLLTVFFSKHRICTGIFTVLFAMFPRCHKTAWWWIATKLLPCFGPKPPLREFHCLVSTPFHLVTWPARY